MVSFATFARVLTVYISITWIAKCVAQPQREPRPLEFEFERPFLRRECNFLNGFNLTPTSFTETTATYAPNSLPILSNGKRISFFSLEAQCGNNVPPTCNHWTVSLEFCNSSPGTCNSSDPSFRQGFFYASGTGPAAYNISGGTQTFIGATGSVDSVFDLHTAELLDVRIFICYRRFPAGPVSPPVTAPAPSPVAPFNPSGGSVPPAL